MRLFTRVRANMDRQRTPLNEALIADMLPGAFIGPLVGMNPEMTLQVRLAIEALSGTMSAKTLDTVTTSSASMATSGSSYPAGTVFLRTFGHRTSLP